MGRLRAHSRWLVALGLLALAGSPCEGLMLCVSAHGSVELAYALIGCCEQEGEGASEQGLEGRQVRRPVRDRGACDSCFDIPIPAVGPDVASAPSKGAQPQVVVSHIVAVLSPGLDKAGAEGRSRTPPLRTDHPPLRCLRTVVLLI